MIVRWIRVGWVPERHRRIGAVIALVGIGLLGPVHVPQSWAGSIDYLLGPQDKLRIKVYDWRKETGEAHEWLALTGEFTVGASGSLSLPLVGDIVATRRTTGDVAHDLSVQLQKRIGLAQQPDASVEVMEYRPFYIVGVVDKAGAYPYRPGMTVMQAVGIAGGLARNQDAGLLGYERDALTTRGELRQLSSQRLALLGRQARFEAEIGGASAVIFPAELEKLKADPDVALAMREEQQLFANGRESLSRQIELLTKSRDLLQLEVSTLAAKDVSLGHQFDLANQELDTVSALVTKGLTIVPRKLAIQQSISQFESSRLDIQVAALRAREDMTRIDRDIVDIRDKRRSAALTEAREVREKIIALAEQIDTAQSLIFQAETRAPRVIAEARDSVKRGVVYTLTRQADDTATTQTVAESDRVQPGDTLRVELHDPLLIAKDN